MQNQIIGDTSAKFKAVFLRSVVHPTETLKLRNSYLNNNNDNDTGEDSESDNDINSNSDYNNDKINYIKYLYLYTWGIYIFTYYNIECTLVLLINLI